METTQTGAIRSSEYTQADEADGLKFALRYDLILKNPEMLKAVADAYGEGMKKYGRDNWQKGFKESVMIQHALTHLIHYVNGTEGDGESPLAHLGHAIWNLGALCWNRKHHPELMDVTGPDPGPENKKPTIKELEEILGQESIGATTKSISIREEIEKHFPGVMPYLDSQNLRITI